MKQSEAWYNMVPFRKPPLRCMTTRSVRQEPLEKNTTTSRAITINDTQPSVKTQPRFDQTGLRLFCSTQSIQVLVLSNISSPLSKQEGEGGVWGSGKQKQTGKILQLYITKGMTQNPVNKLTPSRFITTKLNPFIASDDDDNVFFTSQAKQSEQTADAIHQPK